MAANTDDGSTETEHETNGDESGDSATKQTSAPEQTGDVPDRKTARQEGVVLEIGEGDPETVREDLRRLSAHRRGTYAEVSVLYPTAELERLLLEVEETGHDTVSDLIRTLVQVGLAEFFDASPAEQVDVEVSDDVWARARLDAAAAYQRGEDPETAFHNRMIETTPTHHNYVPEGSDPSVDPYTPDDLPIDRGAEVEVDHRRVAPEEFSDEDVEE